MLISGPGTAPALALALAMVYSLAGWSGFCIRTSLAEGLHLILCLGRGRLALDAGVPCLCQIRVLDSAKGILRTQERAFDLQRITPVFFCDIADSTVLPVFGRPIVDAFLLDEFNRLPLFVGNEHETDLVVGVPLASRHCSISKISGNRSCFLYVFLIEKISGYRYSKYICECF